METKDILYQLLKSEGVNGFEADIKEKAIEMLSSVCSEVKLGKEGGIIGFIPSQKPNAKKLMIDAHLDKIGLMVTKIDDNGFVSFSNIGGVDTRILPGAEVYILGKSRVYGIVGAKPPHLKSKEDKDKLPKINELLIDTGMDKSAILKKVSIGDAIAFKSKTTSLFGGEISAPSMDNRAGMTAVFEAVSSLKNAAYDIYISFSTEEETGLLGAYSLSEEIMPDLAVVVDVTHGMTPDTKDEIGVFKTGSGTIICRGPNFDNGLTKKLIECAKKNDICYDIEVASGNSGTNAWAIMTAGAGVKTLLLSIPLKYMHTLVEAVDVSDISETAKLIKLICEGGLLDA